MSTPPLPANKLTAMREAVLPALVQTLQAVGWPPKRAHSLPPSDIVPPMAFLDAFTVSSQGAGAVATLPIVLVVDGTIEAQLRQLDAMLAVLWTKLENIHVDGSALQLLTAGPSELDIGGPRARTVVLVVQLGLSPRTLCPESLMITPEEPTP